MDRNQIDKGKITLLDNVEGKKLMDCLFFLMRHYEYRSVVRDKNRD